MSGAGMHDLCRMSTRFYVQNTRSATCMDALFPPAHGQPLSKPGTQCVHGVSEVARGRGKC